MSQITFAVRYAESFRRGVSCPVPPSVTLDIDPARLTAEERELLADRLTDDGIVQSHALYSSPSEQTYAVSRETGQVRDYRRVSVAVPVTADTPDLAGVVAAIAAENAAIAAEIIRRRAAPAAALQAAREWALNEMAREPTRQTVSLIVELRPDGSFHSDSYRLRDSLACVVTSYTREYIVHYGDDGLTAEEAAEYRARHDRLDRESAERKQAAIDAAGEQLRREHWQPRLDWIAAHGSPRLQMMVVEGIGFARTYESERAKYESDQFGAALATARPGWCPIEESDIDRAIADVSLRTLALLAAARAIDPAAKLAKRRDSGKYVAVAEYRGRLIAWPRD